MDFFEHQERARKRSGVLLFYFVVALILIVLAVYGVFLVALYGQKIKNPEATSLSLQWWYPELFAAVSVGTLGLVFLGSAFKTFSLRKGGEAVAGLLGGLPIDPNTRDADQKKILNIVEEMSIASGVPRPPVFLLEEEGGINAFAAGYSPSDAVIGVTQGCIEQLSRDELQGVIAHEYSHILNGDMRTNIRMIGVLHGILLIALIGEILMRSAFHSGHSRRRSRDKEGGGAIAIFFLGIALMIVGYIGVFFGKLIKSALSRQREFLADASAVQFTRNPDGISGALKKIGGFVKGSRIKNAHAEETSHFFFGDGVRRVYFNSLATHPPIEERIRRIDPQFEGKLEPPEVEEKWGKSMDDGRAELTSALAGTLGAERLVAMSPAAFVAQTGLPATEHLAYARRIHEDLPSELVDAARDAYGARAVIYGLLLDPDKSVRQKQLNLLAQSAEKGVLRDLRNCGPRIRDLQPEFRIPLVDLCLPGLKGLSENQYKQFRDIVGQLIRADEKIVLFEFAIGRILMRHLDPHFYGIKRNVASHKTLTPVANEVSVLLSALAHMGNRDPAEGEASFQGAVSNQFFRESNIEFLPKDQCGLPAIIQSLDRLAAVVPKLKKGLLSACAEIVLADRKVLVKEAELLRVVADSLDCPMPPLLPQPEVE